MKFQLKTRRHQTRYQPLQPYMDASTLAKYSQPWKQVIIFFVRAQIEHEWDSPVYEFTARQRHTWKRFWREARRAADSDRPGSRASEQSADSEGRVGSDSRVDSNRQVDCRWERRQRLFVRYQDTRLYRPNDSARSTASAIASRGFPFLITRIRIFIGHKCP